MEILREGNDLKITFVSFQNINNNIPTGMVKFMLPIINKIDLTEDDTYYVSSSKYYNGSTNIKEVGILFKIINKLVQVFRNLFPNISYGKIRFFLEVTFDYIFSKRLKKATILVSTAYLKKSALKNKQLGGINIFIAGNPDDREIYKIMINEQKY